VYLTGPYRGAPFGLSIVTHVKVGPFNLGKIVTRAALSVNPSTAQATITTDTNGAHAIPKMIDGIPADLRLVNVTINRQGFLFNPTNCAVQKVTGEITSLQGAKAAVASRFTAGNCAGLAFKPALSVSSQANTSKALGASLKVNVSAKQGPNSSTPETNLKKVELQLPLALPSRLTTLQKACPAATFETNPALCPSASNIGSASAVTPVLQSALAGPAYLVSHGGAAFPDVEFVLQANERGSPIEILLDGKTQIKHGVTYSRFESIPDAPVSSFEVILPEGPYSVLSASTNLCHPTTTKTFKQARTFTRRVHGHVKHVKKTITRTLAEPLVIPTFMEGQDGAQIHQNTKVSVLGCPKVKKAKKATVAKHATKKAH
jgi:hypothetical protein